MVMLLLSVSPASWAATAAHNRQTVSATGKTNLARVPDMINPQTD
jgi:hypothetical protein